MPDRIVRQNILTSDSVNKLDWGAEVFYRRLMSVADDYGLYDARPAILRAQLYPLQLHKVAEPDVDKWMRATAEAGLVRLYTANGRPYLEVLKFEQRMRQKRPKFPRPPDTTPAVDCQQPADNCTQPSDYDSVSDSESGRGVGRVLPLPSVPLPPPSLTDTQWLGLLKNDPAYAGIDVDREHAKMCRWCEVNNKKPSRKRFINWLNRVEKPMSGSNSNGSPRRRGPNI